MSASGVLAIPPELGFWSPCLVAEAVGQLAAWSAMARADFRVRPLAGIAGEVRVASATAPGTEIRLRVAIEHSDDEAVSYGGSASVGGVPVLELERCLGPMFPADDYDDPVSLRIRFEELRETGAPADRFEPLQRASVTVTHRETGRLARARIAVPETAAFFADHFPRRAVYPATLLLDHQIELALGLVAEAASDAAEERPSGRGRPAVARVTNSKMRSFVLPGQTVDIEAKVKSAADGTTRVALTATADGRRVSTAQAVVGTGDA